MIPINKVFRKVRSLMMLMAGGFLVVTPSCSNELSMLFPEGPQGPAGLSAYEVWVESVENGTIDWPADQTDVTNFFLYLKGKDGKNGIDGVDGLNGKSAYEIWKEQVLAGIENPHKPGEEWPKDKIALNDFWYYLTGADGRNGSTPKIGENGNWWIDGIDTGIPARGKDGKNGKDAVAPVVTIGVNGNWYINGVDTGMPSRGADGSNGKDGVDGKDGRDGKDAVPPTVTIGANGNWYINGVDTGSPSRGENGADGKDGETPVVTIGLNGNWWVNDEDTGVPARGQDGKDGKDGETSVITIGNNGNWYIDGIDTGRPSRGADGKDGIDGNTPDIKIGTNGNWWINGEDTGVPARGQDGKDGADGKDGQNGKDGVDGKDGKDGVNGLPGFSPEVKIGDNGNWWINGEDTGVPARGQDGKDGTDGKDGQDGKDGTDGKDGADGKDGVAPTVQIGINGNWYVDGIDTGVPARGQDGKDGSDGKDGTDGKDGADGKDGSYTVVTIGTNGNWWINGEDTGEPAHGKDGKDGVDGKDGNSSTVAIGENGNWYIDSIDTGIPARGADGKDGQDGTPGKDGVDGKDGQDGAPGKDGIDGKDGQDGAPGKDGTDGKDGQDGNHGKKGKSAYEIWVEEVLAGNIEKDGVTWPKNQISLSDFWAYLRGADGKDGKDGEDGGTIDDNGPAQPDIEKLDKTKAHVIAMYAYADRGEYVTLVDGSVRYMVILPSGIHATIGVKVKLPYVKNPDKEYECNSDGFFDVPAFDLPTDGANRIRPFGKPTVISNGESLVTSTLTFVPNKVDVKILSGSLVFYGSKIRSGLSVYRKMDPTLEWELIPAIDIASKFPITLYAVDLRNGIAETFAKAYGYTNDYFADIRQVKLNANLTYSNFTLDLFRLCVSNRDFKASPQNAYWWPEGDFAENSKYWDAEKVNSWGHSMPELTNGWDRHEKRYIAWGIQRIYGIDNILSDKIFQDLPLNMPVLLRAKDITILRSSTPGHARVKSTLNVVDGADSEDPSQRPIDYDLLFRTLARTENPAVINGKTIDVYEGVLIDRDSYNNRRGAYYEFNNKDGESTIKISNHRLGVSINEPTETTTLFYYPGASIHFYNNFTDNQQTGYWSNYGNSQHAFARITEREVDGELKVELTYDNTLGGFGVYDIESGHPWGFSPDIYGEVKVESESTETKAVK